MKIKQIWIPYREWEDWKSGMWRKIPASEVPDMLELAVSFTGDHERYGEAMREVVWAWPRTMLNSLTNRSLNQRAFLGHCACQFKHSIPEYITRQAWGLLTDKQRWEADNEAQKTIDSWKIWHYNKRQLRLPFPCENSFLIM